MSADNVQFRFLKQGVICIDIIPEAPGHPIAIIEIPGNEKQVLVLILTTSPETPIDQSTYNSSAKQKWALADRPGKIKTKLVFDKPLKYNPDNALKYSGKSQNLAPALFLIDKLLISKISVVQNGCTPNLHDGKIQNNALSVERLKASLLELIVGSLKPEDSPTGNNNTSSTLKLWKNK